MSFRARLWLFLALIVIVPIIALALVLFSLTASRETDKADAGIAQGARTASVVHEAGVPLIVDNTLPCGKSPPIRRCGRLWRTGASALPAHASAG